MLCGQVMSAANLCTEAVVFYDTSFNFQIILQWKYYDRSWHWNYIENVDFYKNTHNNTLTLQCSLFQKCFTSFWFWFLRSEGSHLFFNYLYILLIYTKLKPLLYSLFSSSFIVSCIWTCMLAFYCYSNTSKSTTYNELRLFLWHFLILFYILITSY